MAASRPPRTLARRLRHHPARPGGARGAGAGGLWANACRLVSQYEFADARILRGVYRPDSALLGRNMLLEGRFFGLRFYLGVRVTGVIDEERDAGDGLARNASGAGVTRPWRATSSKAASATR